MIELLEFQAKASNTIVSRYVEYSSSPVLSGKKGNLREVPFFQFLSSLTASGKTVMMADAVAGIGTVSPVAPVILWLSRGKVVVQQTYANLLPGGRYNHLLNGAEVRALGDFDADELRTVAKPFVYLATVGTFTRADRLNSDLSIYASDLDDQESSKWDLLKNRLGPTDVRRPLVIVYDEAHNLSDLQTEILLEQEPAAFILASATMVLPSRMEREIRHLRDNGWSDNALMTRVDAHKIADSGLVKSTVVMAGYRTPMEEAVDQMLLDKAAADSEAKTLGAPGPTKAIYVCNTNIIEGNASQRDNTKVPFNSRQAPPILIWRYLVEQRGIPAADIAVYCSLAFDKGFPPPDDFALYKGGAKDYANFVEGSYTHIIFNLSLQEGWDDPLCYFAYIDKSMQSRVQVEQIIGRVLRQPGLTRYPSSALNTAHFYVRVDKAEVFNQVLDAVEERLRSDAPEINFIASRGGTDKPIEMAVRSVGTVPATALLTAAAAMPIQKIIEDLHDYRQDSGANIESAGARTSVQRKIGETPTGVPVWEEFETSSFVLARWIFAREVRSRYARALEVALTSDPKFDAKIGLGSKADKHIIERAELVVDTYLNEVVISQKPADPYTVGSVLAKSKDLKRFEHSLHEGYSDLNPFEAEFAVELDSLGLTWCRNPARVGYGIPLVSMGATSNFYPDFILWQGNKVHLLDTKGEHLIKEAVARKLLNIRRPESAPVQISVSFISKGKWRSDIVRESSEGVTIWGLNPVGNVKVAHAGDLNQAVGLITKDVG